MTPWLCCCFGCCVGAIWCMTRLEKLFFLFFLFFKRVSKTPTDMIYSGNCAYNFFSAKKIKLVRKLLQMCYKPAVVREKNSTTIPAYSHTHLWCVYIHTNTNMSQHSNTGCSKLGSPTQKNTSSVISIEPEQKQEGKNRFGHSFLKEETFILDGCHWIMQFLTSANYPKEDNLSLELAHWIGSDEERFKPPCIILRVKMERRKSQGSEVESKLNGGTGLLHRRLHTKQVWTQAGWCVHPQSGMQRYIASNTPRCRTEPDWDQIISGFSVLLHTLSWRAGILGKLTDLHKWLDGRQSAENTTNQGKSPQSGDNHLIVFHTS